MTGTGLIASILITALMLMQAIMSPNGYANAAGHIVSTESSNGSTVDDQIRDSGSFDSLAAYTANGDRIKTDDLRLPTAGNVSSWYSSDRFDRDSGQRFSLYSGERLPWLALVDSASIYGCTGVFVGPNVLLVRLSCVTRDGAKTISAHAVHVQWQTSTDADECSRHYGYDCSSVGRQDEIDYDVDRIYVPQTAVDAIEYHDGMNRYIDMSTDAWAIITIDGRTDSWLGMSTSRPSGHATEYTMTAMSFNLPAKSDVPVLPGDNSSWYMSEGTEEGVLINDGELVGLAFPYSYAKTYDDGKDNDVHPQPVIAVTDTMKAAVASLTVS